MIRLSVRLALGGGREAAVRLAITAAAVAVGVGMLLVSLAAMNELHAENDRAAWLSSSGTLGPGNDFTGGPVPGGTVSPANASRGLWWMESADQFGNQTIARVDVAATAGSPRLPGIAHLPAAGQYYASPALTRLLRSTPAAELGDRFPGRQIGTIGPSALASPSSLVIVVGHSARQLSGAPFAQLVTSIATVPGPGAVGTDSSTSIEIILAIGACALLFPVLIFIGAATRLAATRREQRFAAMRLVGATPRQVALISAVEASIAAVAGVAAGFCLYFLAHPALRSVPFAGTAPFPGELSLHPEDVLAVVFGVPVAAAAVALVALRRVQVSPLGVSRRVTPRAPKAWRVIPLLAGIGVLAWRAHGENPGNIGQHDIAGFFGGFALTMAGLIIAGPWLTKVGSTLIASRSKRPAALIAGRRLADNPRGAYRAISGLILALFITTVSIGVMTTMNAVLGSSGGVEGGSGTVVDQFSGYPGVPESPLARVPGAVLSKLGAVEGVKGVTVVYDDPAAGQNGNDLTDGIGPPGYVSCAQLSRTPALGRCAPEAAVASIDPDYFDQGVVIEATTEQTQAATVWPTAPGPVARLAQLPVDSIVVGTDGSQADVERVRTALEVAFPYGGLPLTIGEIVPSTSQALAEGQRLADVVIVATLVIAGCSLAVSVAGSLSDRKRPFSLLRLTGVPLAALRRVVAIEGAVPLVAGAVLSVATGLLATDLGLKALIGSSVRVPGALYSLVILAGLAASLGVIASTFPLLSRITGPEVARNE
jgi:hypothetical protein